MKTTSEKEEHCIFKCSPEIRKAIFDEGDSLYTLYRRNKVYDTYRVYQCFKCQGFGHSYKHCTLDQVCAKCGGNHRLVDCEESKESCINCKVKNPSENNHRANSPNCPVYKEAMARIRNRTDHGF